MTLVEIRQPLWINAEDVPRLPVGWRALPTAEACIQLKVGKLFEKKTVAEKGRVPVLNQSDVGFLGYHDEEPGVTASPELPVVTFANHTCAMRLMKQPFSSIQNVFPKIGKPGITDTVYFYYATLGRVGLSDYKGHHPVFRQAFIPIPPLSIQHRIADILSAYDELIENNQRRIKILEAIARAIYQEAVKAGPSAAEPKPLVNCSYWRFISENVSAYIGAKRYFATADVDGLAITGPGIEYPFSEKPSRAQKQPIPNSVWFARMKDTYKIAWYEAVDEERASSTMLSSGFAGFEAVDAELWPLLFLAISSKEFHVQKDLYCTGATQMSLTNEGLARVELAMPDEAGARALGRATQPILRQMLLLQRKSESLRRTRDLLLPRLLSGELDVETLAA